VAVIKRYLDAMVQQQAQRVLLRSGVVGEMTIDGVTYPVTTKPATSEQLRVLLIETLGAACLEGLGAEPRRFRHVDGGRQWALHLWTEEAGPALRIEPDGEAPPAVVAPTRTVPTAPAAPTAAHVVPARVEGENPLDALLRRMVQARASDLHLKAGRAPMVRIDGQIGPLPGGDGPLGPAVLEGWLRELMPERLRAEFSETSDADFAHELPGLARFRCNVFRDIAGVGAVFRQIPSRVVPASELGLPPSVLEFCRLTKGLVVVTGPTGSGKSTTLAAMIDWINENRRDHIITIEDPVEFVHADKRCHVNQREVGTHTRGFKAALRAALREDPDVVLVGELRDLETTAMAIETAETGHLVFATLHTNTAASTVDRIIDQFPAGQQAQIRAMLAESLKGVVSQTLLRRPTGGRVAALEVLVVTHAVANLIRDAKSYQIPALMQTGKAHGNQLMSEALLELVRAGTVEAREAYDKSLNKREFGLLLTRSGIRGPWSDAASQETR